IARLLLSAVGELRLQWFPQRNVEVHRARPWFLATLGKMEHRMGKPFKGAFIRLGILSLPVTSHERLKKTLLADRLWSAALLQFRGTIGCHDKERHVGVAGLDESRIIVRTGCA